MTRRQSKIEWTEVTWNPVTGCDRISSGCDNCYALTLAKRLKAMGVSKYSEDGDPRTSGPGFGVTLHERVLASPLSWRTPRVVFVNSMSDLFHAKVPLDYIKRVLKVCAETPQHTYQILTKRSLRLARLAPELDWPSNVWMGVSVENSKYSFRVDHLRRVPAAVRFISAEPLLGPLNDINLSEIDWVIAGGESGQDARVMAPEWATGLRDACLAADVPFFFKQWGGVTSKSGGRTLEGRLWSGMPNGYRLEEADDGSRRKGEPLLARA
ncbi:phage Gp37/Gp68 family protein [Micromonospora chokoriensis]